MPSFSRKEDNSLHIFVEAKFSIAFRNKPSMVSNIQPIKPPFEKSTSRILIVGTQFVIAIVVGIAVVITGAAAAAASENMVAVVVT